MALIDITQQCCDADYYVDIGFRCADAGVCFDHLRPAGDLYWFAMPFWINSSLDVLVFLQVGLFALVALTSWRVFHYASPDKRYSYLGWLLFLAACCFLTWPTFFNTLTDSPAMLFYLEGILLAVLASTGSKPFYYFLSGLLLGLAVLLRAAYFYPVLIACVVFLMGFLVDSFYYRKRQAASLLLLSLFLPLSFQYYLTWKKTGDLSFLPTNNMYSQFQEHLNSNLGGYDTQVSNSSFIWRSRCDTETGVMPNLQKGKIKDALCLVNERLYFYLGSYSPYTYTGDASVRNYLGYGAEEVGIAGAGSWFLWEMKVTPKVAASPLGDRSASFLQAVKPPNDVHEYFFQSVSLVLPPGNYVYSIWLWTDKLHAPMTLDMQQNRLAAGWEEGRWVLSVIDQQVITLTAEPTHFDLPFTLLRSGHVVTRIGAPANSSPASYDAVFKGFYAWGSRLSSPSSVGYNRLEGSGWVPAGTIGDSRAGKQVSRTFSIPLLAVNGLVILLFLRAFWRPGLSLSLAVGWMLLALWVSLMAEGLLSLPEQRFMQPVLAEAWMFALLFLVGRMSSHYNPATR